MRHIKTRSYLDRITIEESGEKIKKYPIGKMCSCCKKTIISEYNPRTTCFHCQAAGVLGDERKAIIETRQRILL